MTTIADSTDRTPVRLVLLVLAVLVLAPLLATSLADSMMETMGHWGYGGDMVGVSPWWSLGMGLVWLALLALVGYGVYRARAPPGGGCRHRRRTRGAPSGLRRGDPSDEEFESRRVVWAGDRSDET